MAVTQEQLLQCAEMAKVFANKVVFAALIEVVNEFAPRRHRTLLVKRLTECIECIKPGTITLAFDDGIDATSTQSCDSNGYTLNLCLCVVDRNYRTEAYVPDENYARDLYSKYDMLKTMATTYYKTMLSLPHVRELVDDIIAVLPPGTLGDLVVDETNPTTMYLCASSSKRIGIFCYYTNAAGQVLRK